MQHIIYTVGAPYCVGELAARLEKRGWQSQWVGHWNRDGVTEERVLDTQALLDVEAGPDAVRVVAWRGVQRDQQPESGSQEIWLRVQGKYFEYWPEDMDDPEYLPLHGEDFARALRGANCAVFIRGAEPSAGCKKALSFDFRSDQCGPSPDRVDKSLFYGALLDLLQEDCHLTQGEQQDEPSVWWQIRDANGLRLCHPFDLKGTRRAVTLEEPADSPDYLGDIRAFYDSQVAPLLQNTSYVRAQPEKGRATGCSLEEIEAVEKGIGYRLPAAYRQYLQWMGRQSCGVWWGRYRTEMRYVTSNTWSFRTSELFSEHVRDTKNPSVTLIASAKTYCAFLFNGEHEWCAWFELPYESENPRVYSAHIPSLEGSQNGSFTDFLWSHMRHEVLALQK
jgi:hypothetical protein